ncbi:MAG: site-2 protease family protein [Endomicrobium sp.]|jgi:Zn-dependent protease|nr:site-2 protease family protein [Endomicrobium sp.]
MLGFVCVALLYVIVLFFSTVVHEAAHAYIAYLRGDDTAKNAGRISLNPMLHLDPFGSVLLPFILCILKTPIIFALAKPVPINYRKLKSPKIDISLIAAAGPIANILLCALSVLIINIIRTFNIFKSNFGSTIELFLYVMFTVNIVLVIINLIPIPPLDGSKIVTCVLPKKITMRYLNLNPYIYLTVLFLIASSKIISRFMLHILLLCGNFFYK